MPKIELDELMLSLLTYEPFEVIKGDEKKYIDTILNNGNGSSYQKYHDLFLGFWNYVNQFPKLEKKNKKIKEEAEQKIEKIKKEARYKIEARKKEAEQEIKRIKEEAGKKIKDLEKPPLQWLINWKEKNVCDENACAKEKNGNRYPVLFMKICFYCLTERGFSDKEFLEDILSMRVGILSEWHVSTRYRKVNNKASHSEPVIYRNGKKGEYLTKAIKAAYYESGRPDKDVPKKDLSAPAKEYLPVFVDVFAGTGTVAASVNANRMILNDFDMGAACFLYAVSRDPRPLKRQFVKLHDDFVHSDMSKGQGLYTENKYQHHPSEKKYFIQRITLLFF